MKPPLPHEEWRPIPGYEGLYEVSNLGRVHSIPRVIDHGHGRIGRRSGRILRAAAGGRHPHLKVVLSKGAVRRTWRVHQLVALAFLGPCPEGLQVLHWDDDATNNHLSNLRYGTPGDNGQDRLRNGRNPQRNKTHCPQRHEYNSKNTYWTKAGTRACIPCMRERTRQWRKRRRQQQLGVPA